MRREDGSRDKKKAGMMTGKNRIMAAVFLLLAVLYVFVLILNARRSAPRENPALHSLRADQIEEIRVTSGGEELVLSRADGEWSVRSEGTSGPESVLTAAETDQQAASRFCASLTGIGVIRILSGADPAEYGLDPAYAEVSLTASDGTSVRLAAGIAAEETQTTYVVKDGDTSRIYICGSSFRSALSKKTADFAKGAQTASESADS